MKSIGMPLSVLLFMVGIVARAAGEQKMNLRIHSTAFGDNEVIPRKYTEDGDDHSPPLAWDDPPSGTQELALICDDPDAPTKEPWVHWVIYKIPAATRALKEHVAAQARLDDPAGALQGRNSWPSGRTAGYRGPAPPPGKTHHYRFHLYALDSPLKAELGWTKGQLLKAIEGHILGEGILQGTYRR
jgi:Raf kinase inhibitor-like YbhB/YbcL family protein